MLEMPTTSCAYTNPPYINPIDSEVFGLTVARASLTQPQEIEEALDFCRREKARLLVARCPVESIPLVHEMTRRGFLLMDTLLHFRGNVVRSLTHHGTTAISIRPFLKGEEKRIAQLARLSFQDFCSHYRADPRLDPVRCGKLYESWAYLACAERGKTQEVYVAEENGEIVGFSVVRLPAPGIVEGVLAGVCPRSGPRGIFLLRALMMECIRFGLERGAKRGITSTVVSNRIFTKVCARLGWEQSHAFYTFHKWCGEGP